MPRPRLSAEAVPATVSRVVNRLLNAPVLTGSPRVMSLCQQRATLADQAKQIKEQLAKVDAELGVKMNAIGVRDAEGKLRLETADHRLILIEGENEHIGAAALLAAGVSPKIIAKATKKTPFAYVKVTAKKAQDGEGDA